MMEDEKETEVMDKLFLELSQFTMAKTRRELDLEKALRMCLTVNERAFLDNGKSIHDFIREVLGHH